MDRSAIMSRIRSTGGKIEVSARKFLWKNGIRYRKNWGFGKIDIAITKRKIAIFIDGCFWHRCPKHCKIPKTNSLFWEEKFKRNRKRDRVVSRRLKKEGWLVIRIWEHFFKKDNWEDSLLKKIKFNI